MSHVSGMSLTRAVARILGTDWYADSRMDPFSAYLVGPDNFRLEVELSGQRDAVTLRVCSNLDHIAPGPELTIAHTVLPTVQPGALAREVLDRILPAWHQREAALAVQTERAREAAVSIAATLVSVIPTGKVGFVAGSGASGHFGWEGGGLFFHGQGDGTVKFSTVEFRHLSAPTVFALLPVVLGATVPQHAGAAPAADVAGTTSPDVPPTA